jgi:hypothetical protein
MAELQIQVSAQGQRLLKELSTRLSETEIFSGLLRFFGREGLKAAGYITKEHLSGQMLRRRTGSLARSVTGLGITRNGAPAMRVGVLRGPALAYAWLQEEGGVIKPKKAKALAVPVNEALTPAGVPRKRGPREYKNLMFVRFRPGRNVIGGLFDKTEMEKADNDLSKVKAYFLLLKEAKIPAHYYLLLGVVKYTPTLMDNLIKYLRDVLLARRTI